MSRTAVGLSLAVLSGCVTAPHPPPTAAGVAVTDSHLPASLEARTGQPLSSAQVQTVSQQDIQSTGQSNLADALRRLLPSVQ